MTANSTPCSDKHTLPAIKQSLFDSPSSSSPSIKPKAKKNEDEENGGKQMSLDDVYALIQDMKVDIQNKYQMIDEKVEAMAKNLQEKIANLESKAMEAMKEKVKNESDKMKSKIEADLNESITSWNKQ